MSIVSEREVQRAGAASGPRPAAHPPIPTAKIGVVLMNSRHA